MDTNLMGVVHGCHFFLPKMIEAGGPRRIVNVASLAGVAPAPNMSAYAASKYAVMGLTEVLSLELADTEIGVTAICPGIINTAITADPENVSMAVSGVQLKRLQGYYLAHGAAPEVVAGAIVDAVRANLKLVLVGPHAKPMYHLKRISRSLVRKLTLNDARKNGFL
jgi:NAD(P)-dependent dehydrogenase (short-subunit alcohol dehydrogenase family)